MLLRRDVRIAIARPETLAAAFRLIAPFDGVHELAASGVPVHVVAAERPRLLAQLLSTSTAVRLASG